MTYFKTLIVAIFIISCSSNIYLNPDYSGEKIKGVTLAIIDVNSFNQLLNDEIIDSLISDKGQKLVSPPLKGSISKQSYFSKVNYTRIQDISNFQLKRVSISENSFNLFLPVDNSSIKIDSSDYDYLLFSYCPYDTSNDDSFLNQFFLSERKSTNDAINIRVNNFSYLNEPPNLEHAFNTKFIIDNFVFIIWDNKKNQIVNYGKYDKIWEESFKKVILETGRIVMVKSPFYKSMPPR